MKYFLTGATGFIGHELARQLMDAGHTLVVLARDPARAHKLAGAGAEVVKGDIQNRASMESAMEGVDGVFHMAAWYKVGVRDTTMAESINVEGTRNVLELVRDLKIPRCVYTSTLAIYGDTHGRLVTEEDGPQGPCNSEYERTKRAAHFEVAVPLQKAGVPVINVLPGAVYGPGDESPVGDAFRMWLDGKLPTIPRDTAFCWGHVEDTARGHALAMEKGTPGESYILGGPPHTMIEAFEVAGRVANCKPPPIHLPPGAIRAAAALLSPLSKLIPLPAAYHPESLRSSAGVTYIGSNEKARAKLGFDPRPLEAGFPEYIGWLVDQLDRPKTH